MHNPEKPSNDHTKEVAELLNIEASQVSIDGNEALVTPGQRAVLQVSAEAHTKLKELGLMVSVLPDHNANGKFLPFTKEAAIHDLDLSSEGAIEENQLAA